MRVADLIEQLREMEAECGPDQIVLSWCPEGEDYFPITGFVYGGGDGKIELYTDED